MNAAYAKIFESLFDGSLRGNPDAILVWVNILTHTRHGIADIHFKKISDETGLIIDDVKAACLFLESPDLDSRSPDEEGRRLIRLDDHRDWGWRVVNARKYRLMGGQDDRTKELTRDRVAKFRGKKEGVVTLCNVTETLHTASASASASVPEGDAGEPIVKWEWVAGWLVSAGKAGSDYTEVEARQAWLSLNANGWMWGKNPVADWRSAIESKIQDNRARKVNGNGTTKLYPRDIEAQMRAVQRQIDEHPANPESACHNAKPTDAQRENLRGLRKKMVELNNALANGGVS